MRIDINKIKYKELGYFRFKEFGQDFLLTNEVGEYIFLNKSVFKKFIEGEVDKNSTIYRELFEKNFLKIKNEEKAAQKYAKRKSFLFGGSSLHIFVVTLRCDNKCLYCHASARDVSEQKFDMSKEVAEKSLNLVFSSPDKNIAIEFQGGEPLMNWEIIKYITEESKKRNKALLNKKNLEIRLVTNFNLMDNEKLSFILENDIHVCTSLDGPEELHNKNRPMFYGGKNNYKNVVKWLKIVKNEYKEIKEEKRANAIPTISKYSLKYPNEIIDEYLKNGLNSIFFMPLNPYGFSKNIWNKIGYTSKEYIDFYKKAINYISELNSKGIKFSEKIYEDFEMKIERNIDPNMLDLRNPCGAGISQLTYNYNGNIYTCDAGRMIAEIGDDSFKLGDVNDSYKDIVDNSVVKSVCSASCLEGLPGCEACAYLPYCGVCPLYNYSEHNNIFSQTPNNERCKINKAILDNIFKKKQNK